MATNAFCPEQVQRILGSLQRPAVFMNMTCDWPVLQWTVDYLSQCLGEKTVRFRMGKRRHNHTPLFETQCSYLEAKLKEFQFWTDGETGAEQVGSFSNYPLSQFWAYADYKHIELLLQDKPSMFEDVVWSQFGFPSRDGRDSTLWIGTDDANTPCHLDTYGYNLVLQVQGRKRWHLFPPADTDCLYPTRIPYEESSVFSQVNVLQPDLQRFPGFRNARVHTVTLQPGQVLFVPRHWWHFVECIDPVTISVNSWIELEVDDEARLGEALTKAIVCALKTTPSKDNNDDWLNPTEEGLLGHDVNIQYLSLAVDACMERRTRNRQNQNFRTGVRSVTKRDSTGQAKNGSSNPPGKGTPTPFNVPFGPHLVAVTWNQMAKQKTTEQSPIDPDGRGPTSDSHMLELGSKTQSTGPGTGGGAQDQDVKACDSPTSDLLLSSEPGFRGTGKPSLEDRDQVEGREAHSHTVSVTTNDLLECLVHPEVMTKVTELLLERRRHIQPKQSNSTS
ncbi:hypothetical protein DPEC_G00041780 [Dallia pectoralis]|uniref:Uncharacterized protein n=1 Tax=Dallia pectoralis TaxID=75939 RepID=A0ACC2H8T6_DALPE|nr:hypothetical protein DPEC_G00041780 [Dallia pectoralis]